MLISFIKWKKSRINAKRFDLQQFKTKTKTKKSGVLFFLCLGQYNTEKILFDKHRLNLFLINQFEIIELNDLGSIFLFLFFYFQIQY